MMSRLARLASLAAALAAGHPAIGGLQTMGASWLDEMITRRGRLEDVNEAFRAMKAGEVARTVLMFE